MYTCVGSVKFSWFYFSFASNVNSHITAYCTHLYCYAIFTQCICKKRSEWWCMYTFCTLWNEMMTMSCNKWKLAWNSRRWKLGSILFVSLLLCLFVAGFNHALWFNNCSGVVFIFWLGKGGGSWWWSFHFLSINGWIYRFLSFVAH